MRLFDIISLVHGDFSIQVIAYLTPMGYTPYVSPKPPPLCVVVRVECAPPKGNTRTSIGETGELQEEPNEGRRRGR